MRIYEHENITIQVAGGHDCALEIVMKGYRTEYGRISRWAGLMSRVVNEMA